MELKQSYGRLTALGVQHVFAMFGSTVLVPMLTGLSPAVALFCAGVGTILFHLITGRKVPVFLGSSFSFIAVITAVAGMMSGGAALGTPEYMEGLRYSCGGIIFAGVLYLVLALLVKVFGAAKIRSFFPPLITGPIIMIIGLMLAPTAIDSITKSGGAALSGAPLMINWVIAAITIAVIFIVSLAFKGFMKMLPIIIGIAAGYVVCLVINLFGVPIIDFAPIAKADIVSVPPFMTPLFDIRAIIMIAPIAIVTFVEHIGDINANGEVVGKDFFRDPGLHRTLLGDGLATILAGAIGGPANTTYSENTGVLAATGNYNPVTLEIAALFAILISFIGKFTAFLQTIPGAVMGGVSMILFGMIAAVGLRTLIEARVDFKKSRNLMIVAVMMVLGLGGAAFQVSEFVSISGVALSAIVGIILNKAIPEKNDGRDAA